MANTIFQPPQLRKEELEPGERRATWLELFFDLIFVVAIAQLAYEFKDHYSPFGFLKFALLFIPVWWCWIGATFYDTRFDNDGLVDRLITLLQMAIVAIMAANIARGWESSVIGFALSYIAFRTVLVCQYLHAGYHVPEARSLTNWYALGFSISIIFWLISLFVTAPWHFFLWGIGLIIDFATPLTAGRTIEKIPPNMTHTTERIGLFTIIVLGESIVGVVDGVAQIQWSFTSIAIAILGLAIAFSFWWMYFDTVDNSPLHGMKQGKITIALTWLYCHLPLAIGLTATGVGVEKMIHGVEHELAIGDKFLFCFSVAFCLFVLGAIHWTSYDLGQTKCKKILTFYRLGTAALVLTLGWATGLTSALTTILLVTFACVIQIVFNIFHTRTDKINSYH